MKKKITQWLQIQAIQLFAVSVPKQNLIEILSDPIYSLFNSSRGRYRVYRIDCGVYFQIFRTRHAFLILSFPQKIHKTLLWILLGNFINWHQEFCYQWSRANVYAYRLDQHFLRQEIQLRHAVFELYNVIIKNYIRRN